MRWYNPTTTELVWTTMPRLVRIPFYTTHRTPPYMRSVAEMEGVGVLSISYSVCLALRGKIVDQSVTRRGCSKAEVSKTMTRQEVRRPR